MTYSDMDKLQRETVVNKEIQNFRSNLPVILLSSDELKRAELELNLSVFAKGRDILRNWLVYGKMDW